MFLFVTSLGFIYHTKTFITRHKSLVSMWFRERERESMVASLYVNMRCVD